MSKLIVEYSQLWSTKPQDAAGFLMRHLRPAGIEVTIDPNYNKPEMVVVRLTWKQEPGYQRHPQSIVYKISMSKTADNSKPIALTCACREDFDAEVWRLCDYGCKKVGGEEDESRIYVLLQDPDNLNLFFHISFRKVAFFA